MFFKLFLAFTLIPVAEIYVLITVGSIIGTLNTIAIIIITGVIGAYLARLQGMQTLVRIKLDLEQGVMPTSDLVDGLMILVAGIVLLTPGFITDCVGLFLLIPSTRSLLKQYLKKALDSRMNVHDIEYHVGNDE